MKEPYLGQFKALIRGGAASLDVHDAPAAEGFATDDDVASEAYVQREVERVAHHQRSLTPLLERAIERTRRVLDFGCGTGGTTVALALSGLGAQHVIGVDANARVIQAARLRAAGHGLAPPAVEFRQVIAGDPLPFADGSFDLVTTVSVLEFITDPAHRDRAVAELRRVVAPGGFLFISTPRVALRQYHSRQLLGDFRRGDGMPWSSSWRQTSRWAEGWERLPCAAPVERIVERVPWLPRPVVEHGLAWAAPLASPWQKILVKRPPDDAGSDGN
jgi:SAM-dependent methyltransferase